MRRAQVDESAIEFVDGVPPEQAAAEALDAGPTRPVRRVAVVGLIAVAAAAIGWIAVHHGSDNGPPPGVLPAASITVPVATPTEPLTFTASRPTTCPSDVSCVLDTGLPLVVARAVLDGLPGLPRVTAAQTVRTVRHELWFRQIVARTDSMTTVIDIQHRDAAPLQLHTDGPNTRDVAYVRQYSDGFLVQIEITGPPARLPSTTVLLRLAHDDRLLTLD